MSAKSLILVVVLVLTACGAEKHSQEDASVAQSINSKGENSRGLYDSQAQEAEKSADPREAVIRPVSLKDADKSQSVAQAADRKIIKNGELTLEVESPTRAERQVSTIAESHGGFVVNSESSQRQSNDPAQRVTDVTLVIRVPASTFEATLEQILALSTNVPQKKTNGQDVTEEFIDLEARMKTQKALEAQFLEIMKQAHKVEDALEVQRQIADVRTEIEKLEGRKRFLENRASLSTITVNLKSPSTMAVTTTGFRHDVKEAGRESVDVAASIVLFLIRFVIVMAPIFVTIILPAFFIGRFVVRRTKRLQLARQLAEEAESPVPST